MATNNSLNNSSSLFHLITGKLFLDNVLEGTIVYPGIDATSAVKVGDGAGAAGGISGVYIGEYAGLSGPNGAYNTLIGMRSCYGIGGSGTGLICLGVTDFNPGDVFNASGCTLGAGDSNDILIGNPGVGGDNNTIRIGKNGSGFAQHNRCFLAGVYGVTPAGSAAGVVIGDDTAVGSQLGTISGAAGTILVGDTSPKFLAAGNAGQILASQGAAVDPHWIDNTLYGNVWTDITGASQGMLPGNAYTANKSSLVTFTLPATAAYGSTMTVTGKGTGYWKIEQNAGQTIHNGALSTTPGVTGNITTAAQWASVTMVCIVADTEWAIISSSGTVVLA